MYEKKKETNITCDKVLKFMTIPNHCKTSKRYGFLVLKKLLPGIVDTVQNNIMPNNYKTGFNHVLIKTHNSLIKHFIRIMSKNSERWRTSKPMLFCRAISSNILVIIK